MGGGGGMEDAATRVISASTVPLTTYRTAVQEWDEYAAAAAHLPAFEQQMRETAEQCDNLHVRLHVAERRATIAEAKQDVDLRNKGGKQMRNEYEGASSSAIAVVGPGLGSPSAGAGISSDCAQFLAEGLLDYGFLVTKCL